MLLRRAHPYSFDPPKVTMSHVYFTNLLFQAHAHNERCLLRVSLYTEGVGSIENLSITGFLDIKLFGTYTHMYISALAMTVTIKW